MCLTVIKLMRLFAIQVGFTVGILVCGVVTFADSPDTGTVLAWIASLKSVGAGDAGQSPAREAWAKLTAADPSHLPDILAAIDDASPLAANWIRSAADALVEKADARRIALPRAELERFLFDAKHGARGRRLAYEILLRGDPALAERVLPKMLDDPSLEMRRDAVARAIAAAERLAESKPADQSRVVAAYQTAFDSARDVDQVKLLAERLKELGQTVNLPRHFGFIMSWQVIGPFENRDQKGLPVAYPPERKIDLAAAVQGKEEEVKWHPFVSTDDFGQVDLNKAIGKHLGAVAYATAEFQSDRARPVELRLGTENACKMWLNGKLLFTSEVYHSLSAMDQFIIRSELKPGKNVILLKVCQNEQKEDWAQVWQFQLRATDSIGKAILPQAPTTAAGGGK